MSIITKQDISRLSQVQGPACVSIFIPTHRSGQEVLQKQDALVLKIQLKEVSSRLEKDGYSENEVDEFLKPVQDLLEDTGFWRHQSDGLAIFLAEGHFKTFQLPIQFEKFNYISNEFYLKPLMPMIGGDGRFFILTLELENVNFYEGTRHSIAEVYIDDLTPSRLEERVGFDYREKFLQFRSQQEGQGNALFHGHGDGGGADRKNEIKRYFRAINDGLMDMLHNEDPPMVIAALDYFYPIYEEVNDYNHLMDTHISGNPAVMDILTLHERAWDIVEPHFNKDYKEKVATFKKLHTTDKISSDIKEIIPAAFDGKVDTLFLQNRTDKWGIYDPSDRMVEIRQSQSPANVSLLNMAAKQAFEHGGNVYLIEEDDMPNPHSIVNALYRY